MAGVSRSLYLLITIASLGALGMPVWKRRVRVPASALARKAFRVRAHAYVPKGEPVTLVIAPHQDDDVLGCGGLIARKRLEGYPVHVVYLTDGSASHKNHPTLSREAISELRQTEARRGLHSLGVETPAIHFLGAEDGSLAWLSKERAAGISAQLAALIKEIKPDEIFTPFREDGSSEHEAAFGLLRDALSSAQHTSSRIFEYPVWSLWNPLLLIRPFFKNKRVVFFSFKGYGFLKERAIDCHRSQFEATPPWKKPVISPEFRQLFLSEEEFYFES